MKKLFLILALVAATALFLPARVQARQVCIWQYDSLDRYTEPGSEAAVAATLGLERILSGLGHKVQVVNALPEDLRPYDLIFVSLGWSRG